MEEVESEGKDLSHLDYLFEHGLHIPRRIIFLSRDASDEEDEFGINERVANEFLQKMIVLNDEGGDPIRVILNTSGGQVEQGLAIYDAIKTSKSPVDVFVYGRAYSTGTIILQAGRQRLLSEHSAIMVHDISLSITGSMKDSKSYLQLANKEMRLFFEICAKRSGKNVSYWKKKFASDYYMNAKQAVKEGLADKIVTKTNIEKLIL